jgi:hypothetical protein
VIDVPEHDPLGVVLMSGDELRLGTAAVKLEISSNGQLGR